MLSACHIMSLFGRVSAQAPYRIDAINWTLMLNKVSVFAHKWPFFAWPHTATGSLPLPLSLSCLGEITRHLFLSKSLVCQMAISRQSLTFVHFVRISPKLDVHASNVSISQSSVCQRSCDYSSTVAQKTGLKIVTYSVF